MNSNLLRGKIVAKGMSIANFCIASEIKKNALYRKLSGKTEFTRNEIEKIISVLGLTDNDVMQIFFTTEVA